MVTIEAERQRLAQRLDQEILSSLRLLQAQVDQAFQHQRGPNRNPTGNPPHPTSPEQSTSQYPGNTKCFIR